MLLAELPIDVHQFTPPEDVVVIHVFHVNAFTLAIAKIERSFHYLYSLLDSSVFYQDAFLHVLVVLFYIAMQM